jgi:hypothetical protein
MPAAAAEISPYAGLINAGRLEGALADRSFCLVLPEGMLIASAATLGSRELQERHGFNEILMIREGPDHEVRVVPWARQGQTFVVSDDEQQSIHVSEDDE